MLTKLDLPTRATAAADAARVGWVQDRRSESGPDFEDHVGRRLGHAPHAREARLGEHLAQALLSGLGAQREAYLLAERGRRAEERRRRVVESSNRIEVVLQPIIGEGLHEHPHPSGSERLAHVARGSDWIPHVMQAV